MIVFPPRAIPTTWNSRPASLRESPTRTPVFRAKTRSTMSSPAAGMRLPRSTPGGSATGLAGSTPTSRKSRSFPPTARTIERVMSGVAFSTPGTRRMPMPTPAGSSETEWKRSPGVPACATQTSAFTLLIHSVDCV